MARAERKSLCQCDRPAVDRLARQGIDEIETDAAELLLCRCQRSKAFPRRMRPPEEVQRAIIEALQPEREAVDAGGLEIGKPACLYRIGIGFERDLDVFGSSPVRKRARDHC